MGDSRAIAFGLFLPQIPISLHIYNSLQVLYKAPYLSLDLLHDDTMVKIVVGMMGSSVAKGAALLSTPAGVAEFLSIVSAHNVKEIDTARVYAGGKSEEMLGAVNASASFAISTKAPAFMPHSLSKPNILANCAKSLTALKQDKVDIYYLHGPDRDTPLEEQCAAIGKLYQDGRFDRFGVSNISDAEVQTIYDICKHEGYPLPSVYQGGFNPIGRGVESTLIPLLRKLGMAFYAFSPLGGGLLAKPLPELRNPKRGTRFDEMKVFGDIYLKPNIVEQLGKVQKVCDVHAITLLQATMRWFMHHSCLGENDAVILGASSKEQIEKSLSACEMGPLPEEIQIAWEDLYRNLREDLPRYHS